MLQQANLDFNFEDHDTPFPPTNLNHADHPTLNNGNSASHSKKNKIFPNFEFADRSAYTTHSPFFYNMWATACVLVTFLASIVRCDFPNCLKGA